MRRRNIDGHFARLLEQAYLRNLAALYTRAAKKGLTQTGSSSFDPAYADTCDYVSKLSYELYGLTTRHEVLVAGWRGLGDPSGTLYLGGTRVIDGKREQVDVATHLSFIATTLSEFNARHLTRFDLIFRDFAHEPKVLYPYKDTFGRPH